MNRCSFGLIALSVAAVSAGSAFAQNWVETGTVFAGHADSGQLIGEADTNITTGGGPLSQIQGWMVNNSDRDLYQITVTDAGNFSVSGSTLGSGRNFSLALFATDGTGIVANYDRSAGDNSPLLSNIPGLTNGTYYLLIFGLQAYPTDAAVNFIFRPALTNGGDTGLLFPQPGVGTLAGYGFDFTAGFPPFTTFQYTVDLTGAGYAQLPAPGASALIGLAGLALTRRRR